MNPYPFGCQTPPRAGVLTAAAFLPAFLLGAVLILPCCSEAQDAAPQVALLGARLIGTWELDLSPDPEHVRLMERVRQDAAQRAERLRAQGKTPEPYKPDPDFDPATMPRLRFQKDGTLVLEGSVLGHQTRSSAEWKVTADVEDKVLIEVIDTNKGVSEPMSFSFPEPGVLLMESKLNRAYYRKVE